MHRNMKAITPIIAIIVLLLITVAISGAAWTYISGYWSGTVDKQVEVTDAFCVGTNQAKIIVKNIGTSPMSTGDITIINRTSGADLTENVIWASEVALPDSGMFMHMAFDEGSGPNVRDTAGNNDGVLGDGTCLPGAGTCPGWTSGKMGSALSFDGANDYIQMGYAAPALSEFSGNKLTLAVWIKPSSPTGSGMIFLKNGPIYLYRQGNLIQAGVFNGASWAFFWSTIPLAAGWNHVAMTYDGSIERLYINGVPDTTMAQTGNLASDGCAQIGRYCDSVCGNSPQHYFPGIMDDIRLYTRALSEDEIRALAGNARIEPGGTSTLTNTCSGRCSYNILLGGRSRTASVDCS